MGVANRCGATVLKQALQGVEQGGGVQACPDESGVEVLHAAHDASPD
jgi:hypothetical protein